MNAAAEPRPDGYYHLCPHCKWETFGPGACEVCGYAPALANVLLDEPAASVASTGAGPRPVGWVETCAYALAVVAVSSYLVWETRAFWIGLVEIWFGGK